MAYTNIVWVKVRLELLNDKRFIFDLNNDQKWLFLGLLLLAGSTKNTIPNDENFIKNRLNLPENTEKIRQNLNFIFSIFRGVVVKNGHIKFKNFNELHNQVRDSLSVSPEYAKAVQDKRREEKRRKEKIRYYYVVAKDWENIKLTPNDFSRMNKRINELFDRGEGDVDLICRAIGWVKKQGYSDWTLETVLKKFPDFLKVADKEKEISEMEALIGK